MKIVRGCEASRMGELKKLVVGCVSRSGENDQENQSQSNEPGCAAGRRQESPGKNNQAGDQNCQPDRAHLVIEAGTSFLGVSAGVCRPIGRNFGGRVAEGFRASWLCCYSRGSEDEHESEE